jgi:hypothetical protein
VTNSVSLGPNPDVFKSSVSQQLPHSFSTILDRLHDPKMTFLLFRTSYCHPEPILSARGVFNALQSQGSNATGRHGKMTTSNNQSLASQRQYTFHFRVPRIHKPLALASFKYSITSHAIFYRVMKSTRSEDVKCCIMHLHHLRERWHEVPIDFPFSVTGR